MGGYQIVEHTADVGFKAWADTIEQLFVESTKALLDINDAWRPGGGEEVGVEVSARDLAGVLVDWLAEVLYVQESRDAVITDIHVVDVQETRAVGNLQCAPRAETLEGTAVKAITYHQLKVERGDGSWIAEVYVDV